MTFEQMLAVSAQWILSVSFFGVLRNACSESGLKKRDIGCRQSKPFVNLTQACLDTDQVGLEVGQERYKYCIVQQERRFEEQVVLDQSRLVCLNWNMAKFRRKFEERLDVKYHLGALWIGDELDTASNISTPDDVKSTFSEDGQWQQRWSIEIHRVNASLH
jgi:hypothetical protein